MAAPLEDGGASLEEGGASLDEGAASLDEGGASLDEGGASLGGGGAWNTGLVGKPIFSELGSSMAESEDWELGLMLLLAAEEVFRLSLKLHIF